MFSSIEASAAHEAARLAQAARGALDRQMLENEKEAEKQRTRLNELKAVTAAVESTGQVCVLWKCKSYLNFL